MIARTFLCVIWLAIPGQGAPLLSIDFNHRTNNPATTTQPGFTSFVITSNVSPTSAQTNATIRMIGTNRVTLYGNTPYRFYSDRSHVLPTNHAAFSESLLLRDSVYSPDNSGTNGGLNLIIEGLTPSNRVQVTIWSFDALTAPIRASDWYANKVLVRRAYQFTNAELPISNDQYRFSFTAHVDGAGQLLIEGRRNAMSTNDFGNSLFSVFLNALQIDPEPLEILNLVTNGNEVRLTFVVRPQPGTYGVEELIGTQWRATTAVNYSAATNNRVTARFPKPAQPRLYRIRYNY
jgi:hypothetical protein